MKAFLICPVRGHLPDETFEIVCGLERDGWDVHWPFRDTAQDDPTGFEICSTNREAIDQADMVFVMWDGKSTGCLFDLGIAFALNKLIQVLDAPALTEGKSFQNMMRQWEQSVS